MATTKDKLELVHVIMKTCWQCRGVGVSRYSDKHNMCGVCHGSGKVPNDSYPNGKVAKHASND